MKVVPKTLALLAFMLMPGCAWWFGTPDEVLTAWDQYEVAVKEEIARGEADASFERDVMAKLVPADAEAQVEKARLETERAAYWQGRREGWAAMLEMLRAVGRYVKAPGFFGSPEQQARFDERLLGLIGSIKAVQK